MINIVDMTKTKGNSYGKRKAITRWVSWLFGLALLAAVALFATHRSEGEEFARIVAQGKPAWLIVAVFLQLGTYVADARIWQEAEAKPGIAHNSRLITQCAGLQAAIFLLDAATLWVMLSALGLFVNPARVFAGFVLSTLARTLGPVPGGLGVFEAASIATLKLMGVPFAAGLASTFLFRGFTFWLPMVPGILLARRETRQA
jgi:uncharacterized membrane protein YbhN (UPF0104 family)